MHNKPKLTKFEEWVVKRLGNWHVAFGLWRWRYCSSVPYKSRFGLGFCFDIGEFDYRYAEGWRIELTLYNHTFSYFREQIKKPDNA